MLVRPQTHNNTYDIIWKTNKFNSILDLPREQEQLISLILEFLPFCILHFWMCNMCIWCIIERWSGVWALFGVYLSADAVAHRIIWRRTHTSATASAASSRLFLSTPGEWHFGHKVLKNPILDLKFQPVQWKERFLIVTPLRCSLNGFYIR